MDDKLKEILDKSKYISFFGGAGVSTDSGIPDFRSDKGLYKAKNEYGVSPEVLISHSYFVSYMDSFFEYYKENFIYKDAKPNPAHFKLAELEREGKLKGVITQNVDGLHQMAGSKNVIELHGSVMRNICMDCKSLYSLEYILDPKNCIDEEGNQRSIPYCSKCNGVVKPDVVLYEEMLDTVIMEKAAKLISESDTLIVAGTSLVVHPAAGLINYFRGDNLVLINRDRTPFDQKASLVYHDSIGKVMA